MPQSTGLPANAVSRGMGDGVCSPELVVQPLRWETPQPPVDPVGEVEGPLGARPCRPILVQLSESQLLTHRPLPHQQLSHQQGPLRLLAQQQDWWGSSGGWQRGLQFPQQILRGSCSPA